MPARSASLPAVSAGVLFYRERPAGIELLLVHPGGPFWRNRDRGAWQAPKGLIEPGETPWAAACREVAEELGVAVAAPGLPLGIVRQAGGKRVELFAVAQTIDPERIVSNRFILEWPPRSGRQQSFPEVDRAAWFTAADARAWMLPSQVPAIDRLEALLATGAVPSLSPPPADGSAAAPGPVGSGNGRAPDR